ncbi:MAG: transposase [Steroidobacteraceae bacterium]
MALEHIAGIYAVEDAIRQRGLEGEAKREQRVLEINPGGCALGVREQASRRSGCCRRRRSPGPFAYVRDRKEAPSVFLQDPEVALDTNHLERALRPIPMGRKNWMFCWTELGARDVGIVQLDRDLPLHRIDIYTYLVDVLQRVAEHLASRVEELTPRRWKTLLFADTPLRSSLHTRQT